MGCYDVKQYAQNQFLYSGNHSPPAGNVLPNNAQNFQFLTLVEDVQLHSHPNSNDMSHQKQLVQEGIADGARRDPSTQSPNQFFTAMSQANMNISHSNNSFQDGNAQLRDQNATQPHNNPGGNQGTGIVYVKRNDQVMFLDNCNPNIQGGYIGQSIQGIAIPVDPNQAIIAIDPTLTRGPGNLMQYTGTVNCSGNGQYPGTVNCSGNGQYPGTVNRSGNDRYQRDDSDRTNFASNTGKVPSDDVLHSNSSQNGKRFMVHNNVDPHTMESSNATTPSAGRYADDKHSNFH